jgi:DNA-directed RNA polymerase alpha subunit
MLNIISYDNNILKIEEEIKNEGHTLISLLQNICIKKYNHVFGYKYKHPDEKEIDIIIDDLNVIKNAINNILFIIDNIGRDIKKTEINDNHLILSFKNINKYLVNSIRRIILSEIEILAFDNIKIIENETFLPDEVWKQRIELIPIKIRNININSNLDTDNYFVLKKEFSTEIDNYIISNNLTSMNNNITLVYNDIILHKLNLCQKIYIKAFYKKGMSNNHSKWSVVTNIPLNMIWEFYISKKYIPMILPFYISYNINIIEDENGILIQTDNKKCKNLLKKINIDNKFNDKIIYSKIIKMNIKSIGQYNSNYLFNTALNILKTKYKDFLYKLNIFLEKE